MLPQISKRAGFQHARGHILVLDALVGQDRRGQGPVQIHPLKAFDVQRRDAVIAFPKRFQLRRRQALQRRF